MRLVASVPEYDESPPDDATTQKNSHIVIWICPNCGQTHFTINEEEPPDICDYCHDMTTWQQVERRDNLGE